MSASTSWLGVSLLVVSCASSTPEPAEPRSTPVQDQPGDARGSGSAVGTAQDASTTTSAGTKETRTPAVIRAVVNRDRGKIRRCFDALSSQEKGNGGMLTIAFKLTPKGDVQSANLNAERSTLKQPKLVTCAVAAFKTLKFPASSRGFESNGNYPFNFKP
jgi:hypothetical protein